MFTVALWKGQPISLLSLIPRIEKSMGTKQNLLRRFSPENLSKCEQEFSQVSQELDLAEIELSQATANWKREKGKLDRYLADISIFQK